MKQEQWRKDNKDKMNQYRARWRANNPDKQRECATNWREQNRERYRELHRKFKESHPGYEKDYHRKYIITQGNSRIRANKRAFPTDNCCEVCGEYRDRLEYHHWDDEHPCLGLWLCSWCHHMAEKVDKGLHVVYLREKHGMVLVTS